MNRNKLLAELSSVFGAFSHEPPQVSAGQSEREAAAKATPQEAEMLPETPVYSKSGTLLIPTVRFDGYSASPPWNRPEPLLWDMLRQADIEHVEERVLDGTNATFWARIRQDDELRSVLLKFDAILPFFYKAWGSEYMVEPGQRLAREVATYEVAKACGMEDLVPPLAPREVNPVPLISDAVREQIGRQLRVSPNAVDDRLGTGGVVQLMPMDADNFLEHWSTLGITQEERWARASDSLRHSLYRAYAFDFLVGCHDRLLCDYLYNRGTDRIAIVNLALSLPNPAITAQLYLEARAKGWGRKIYTGLDKVPETAPATSWDVRQLFESLSPEQVDEAISTFKQMSEALTDDILQHVVVVLTEHRVPEPCIAGFISRVAYLDLDPLGVLMEPVSFVRNVLAPLSRGYGTQEGTNAQVIEFTNQLMQSVSQQGFDFSSVLSGAGEEQEIQQ